jgi:hypothetical protein
MNKMKIKKLEVLHREDLFYMLKVLKNILSMKYKLIIKMLELIKLKIDIFKEVLSKMLNSAFLIILNKVYQHFI